LPSSFLTAPSTNPTAGETKDPTKMLPAVKAPFLATFLAVNSVFLLYLPSKSLFTFFTLPSLGS